MAIRLLDRMPTHPILTLTAAMELLGTTKPTASKAIGVLRDCGILSETTGKRRDRVYDYRNYLRTLTQDTEAPETTP
jgi:Fic family protein